MPKINLKKGNLQRGTIKVHTQIINDLSSGIYSSPSSCIKELINNSYDAEATLVTIRIKPIQDTITVIDDGFGMNAEDFDKKFAWISKSHKRDLSELSPNLNRPLIGKIGIGFIAVNEICDELEITSSKKGENVKFTATINFKKYFDEINLSEDITDQANNDESENINVLDDEKGIIKATYDLINEDEDVDEHYTIIRLLSLKEGVINILDGKLHYVELLKEKNKDYERSYFKSMKDLVSHHTKNNFRSYSEDNEYVKFIIDLSSYIPVEYLDDAPIENVYDQVINSIVKDIKLLNFKVDLDGIYLKKPIFFPDKSDVLRTYKSFSKTITLKNNEELKFKGYFYSQNRILYPREENGLSIKIKGIPIASQYGYDTTFMQFPSYLQQLFMNWISGEIYIEKGLENSMNIDRASFRLTHPHYLALQDFVHKYIQTEVLPMVMTLYDEGKNTREERKENERTEDKKRFLHTKNLEVKEVSRSSREEDYTDNRPVQINKNTSSKTVITIDKSYSKRFKKKDWEYLQDIFLIFELSFNDSDGDIEKLRSTFYNKINDWKSIK